MSSHNWIVYCYRYGFYSLSLIEVIELFQAEMNRTLNSKASLSDSKHGQIGPQVFHRQNGNGHLHQIYLQSTW